jgi:predicted nucleic acid-binding Zn ribbon protein
MERAGKSLTKLNLGDSVSREDLARAAWPAAVGKRIALHAVAKSLVRGSLIVEVDDAVWQQQLFHLRFSILAKLRETVGNGVIEDVEFRIATPRRPPQPARSLNQRQPADEADGISDPVLRIVYKQARKKASA